MSGRPTSRRIASKRSRHDGLERRARAVAFGAGELAMAFELLGERLAQRRIVVDDQVSCDRPAFYLPESAITEHTQLNEDRA